MRRVFSPIDHRKLRRLKRFLCVLFCVFIPATLVLASVAWAEVTPQSVLHRLQVRLEPVEHRLTVEDKLRLPPGTPEKVRFTLHAGLQPIIVEPDVQLTRHPSQAADSLEQYTVQLPEGRREFTLRYGGQIHHPLSSLGEDYAKSFAISPGLIGAEGVFLTGESYWYPVIETSALEFELAVHLPVGWASVSQGERIRREADATASRDTWRITSPQEEIYLVAAPFTEYHQPAGQVEAMAFLREPDPALAQKYLDATGRYLKMYERLIGRYPYSKFALVENFWETGYGMPSFTLLGPKVIRLPFILTSSYPHEILHNYWGNGVYVDYAAGNWSEGLTSYLADHLLKEQQGQGVEYRRAALQKYADYVQTRRDFPLREFHARHSAASEAVGYGKGMMLFHMLRLELGDKLFTAALQSFYRHYLFREAGFGDLEKIFSTDAQHSLKEFFAQWVERPGAPQLRLAEARVERDETGYRVHAVIEQTQLGETYSLRVPVAIHLVGGKEAIQRDVRLSSRRTTVNWRVPAKPWRLDVDPEFDVFRKLDRNEIPPALSQAFGATQALIVLPAKASAPLKSAYQELARQWQGGRVRAVFDAELKRLPDDRAVWLLGWENRFRPKLSQVLKGYALQETRDAVVLDEENLSRKTHSVVLAGRHPGNPAQALIWIANDNPTAMPGLAAKLPHYGKYSYLAFRGDEPTNVVKGQWPVVNSPLSVRLDESETALTPGKLTPRKALVDPTPEFSSARMLHDIQVLADDKLAGRGLGTPELDRAAEYIAREFREAGLKPMDDSDYTQRWSADVPGLGKSVKLKNVVGIIPGVNPQWRGQSVVIGAHYDHLGRGWPDVHAGGEGKIHPGADDNASGVAVLLELARKLAPSWRPQRTVVFVAFTGEEAGRLGSRHYVRQASVYPAKQAIGMVNLDMVGRLRDQPLLVLGGGSASEWPHIFRGVGFVTGIPVVSTIEAQAIASSDQQSFLDSGVPAVHLLSTPHADYHRPTDTADKIDAEGLVKVATVVKETLDYLAERPEALTSRGGTTALSAAPGTSRRKVTLGTVPDYTYAGKGMRLSGVTPGTPAEAAGLRAGDIIIGLNAAPVTDLSQFATRLRGLNPGDVVTVRYVREGREQTAKAQLMTR
jgi:hypothetical protein